MATEEIEEKAPSLKEISPQLVESTDPLSQFKRGICYLFGIGIKEDKPQAVNYLKLAAEQGHVEAQNILGDCYFNGIGTAKDAEMAVRWLRLPAERGYVSAQFNLGVCYKNGEGVDKDEHQALKWLQQAAEQGHTKAMLILGELYVMDEALKDEDQAIFWLQQAADREDVEAKLALGFYYRFGALEHRNYQQSEMLIRQAAEQGNADAQYVLSRLYFEGDECVEVKKDESQALRWLKQAAEKNHVDAQLDLGLRYKNGDGIDQDEERAVGWLQQAANQGNATAQLNLGLCYLDGRGVAKKDERVAWEWFKQAAKQGDKRSARILDILLEKVPVFVNKQQPTTEALAKVSGSLGSNPNKFLSPVNPHKKALENLLVTIPPAESVIPSRKGSSEKDNCLVM